MDSLDQLPWKSKAPLSPVAKDERLLRSTHRHWMKYAPAVGAYVMLFSLYLAALFIAASLASSGAARVLLPAALIFITVIQHWFFHFILSENASTVILTNKRILWLNSRLWIDDRVEEAILVKLKMVQIHRAGILQRLLDYGDLRFDIAGGQTIPFLPAPKTWAEQIERNMR